MQTKETMVSPSPKILSDCGERENGIVSEDLPKTCKGLFQKLTNELQELRQLLKARTISREDAIAFVHCEIQHYEGRFSALVFIAAVSAGLMAPLSWEQFNTMFPERCKKGTFHNAHKRETWTTLTEAFVEGYRLRFHQMRTGF